jgi:tetratricopeptide (TPR) repeat protein
LSARDRASVVMRAGRGALLLGTGLLLLAGCATAYVQGQADLRGGRPAEARRHFEEALARRPDRLDALAGLGVAEYKLGAFERAVPLFERVVSRLPNNGEAHLYLALAHLQTGNLERAAALMREARQLGLPSRTVAKIDRALPLLEPGVADAVRAFVATSLEDDLEWAAEVHDARTAPRAWLEPSWIIYSDYHAIYRHIHGVP